MPETETTTPKRRTRKRKTVPRPAPVPMDTKKIRFPLDMVADLQKRANDQDRSLNWLVRHYCEQGLARDGRRRA